LELPIIGSLEGRSPTLMADLGNLVSKQINQLEPDQLTSTQLDNFLEKALTELGIPGVNVTTKMTDTDVYFAFDLSKEYNLFKLDLSSDLGVPALGIGFETQGQLTGNFKYDIGLGFGINKLLGFYLDPDKTKFSADVSLNLGDFKGKGNLGFLQVDFADDPKNPTKLGVSFNVKLKDPQAGKNNLKKVSPPVTTINVAASPVETTPADQITIPQTQSLPSVPTEKAAIQPLTDSQPVLPKEPSTTVPGKNIKQIPLADKTLTGIVAEKTVQYNQNLSAILATAPLTSTFTNISAQTIRSWLGKPDTDVSVISQQVINALKNAAPAVKVALQTLLKDAGQIDIGLNDKQLQITYLGTIDVTQLKTVVPGVKDLPLDGLKLPVTKPRLTITNPGLENANYTFAADSLPTAELVTWLANKGKTLLPAEVQTVLNELLKLGQNLDVVFASDQIQVTYQGSLDIAQLRGVIPGIKDLPLNGLTLPVEKPSITITDPGSKSANYTFTAASLPKAQLVNWLSNQAKTLLPTQVQEVLNKLLALTQNVDLVLGKEQIQITAKGDLDIATVIREIPGVKELPLNDLSLPVKNPSITITNPQSKNASYIFVAESLPKQQLANWVTQKATTLLPTEVQDVLNKLLALTNTVDLVLGKNQIEVAYKGNLNLATLIKEIPGVKDLPLGGLTLDVTNPRLTITNPTSANPDYAFAVDSLPKRQIINWLGNQGKSLLPQEVQTILNQLLTSELERVDLVLGKKQMQITYKGDLQLDSFIKFIPGLSDLPLDGLNLPVTNPSLTLVNLEQGVNNIDYVFSVDRLPKDELTKWLREKAVSLLPQEVRNVLDNLLQVAENVDLKLGKNQIQVAYLGNLELGAILKQIPGIQDLPLDTLKLPVTNPKLTIINPNSQDIDYSFVADNLPKQELIDWLVQQLPDNVKSILNTVSNAAQQVDVLFSDRQLQLGYKGNIDLAKIVKVIPGIQELPNLDSLALPVANPRLTLSNLGTKNLKNIDYTFSSDSLPKAELVNWVKTTLLQQLPADVQSFLQKALDIVKNIDLKFGNNQIQIGYLGDLNLKTIIDQIGTQLGDFLSPLKGLNLTLTNPSITITNPKQTPSLSFGVDNLPMNQVKTWLTEQVKTYVSDASVQNFLTGLLNEIAQIDLVVGDTQTQITYLGTVDLAKALKTIPGLESFTPNNLTLPILNPSFTVTRTGKTRTFSLSAESLPKQELTEWLGTEIKNQLPAEVRSIVDSLLAVADKMDVQLGSNQVQFNYQGALDLATIIKEIPGLKELPVNNLQLPVLNPRLAITNPGKNASYSFAADELPKTQLVTWIKQQLPTDVQSVLDTITAQAQQLDVVVGNNQIQLTYNGAVDLVKVLGLIPGVKELLPATTQPLNIINPSLTILNPGKNASFSFAADKLPKQELLDLISSQIPTEVKSVFNNLSENLDVIFGQGIIQVNYRGDVDLMKIASLIPGVKELPLNGLKLNVTNPSFTLINKGKAAGATLATFDYVFAADKLPTQDLINWAKNTAADILPAEVKGVLDKLLNIAKDVNFTLGNGQMQIAYNGNLDIAQVIGLIPGLQDVSVFKGLNLPVTNPSITIINPKPGTGLKTQYLLKSDRLPKEELAKWAKEKATALLPADVAKILGSLSAIAQGINLEIGTNQIQLSYEGTVDLSSILKEIPGVNQLPLDKLKLPVLNPSLTITNPGKNASYSFAAAQLPKEQLINWLKDQAKALIPSELLSIFNTLANIGQNLDVRFGDSQLQVMYQGNLNLVDILKSIPGLSSFNVSDLTLNVQNPSITILNPGRNADFSFKADKLPVKQLKDWLTKKVVNSLPEVAENIIEGITGVVEDVNVLIDKNDIQVLYNGSLDILSILQKIPGVKDVPLPPAGTLSVINPAITLTKVTGQPIDFSFTGEKLNKDGLKKWLIDAAKDALPTSIKDLVTALIDTAADFDVLFKNNKLQISYAGTLDAAKVIQKIPGLSELQTTGLALPITNPILTIYDLDKGISKANYTFAADHLPKEELINWLTKQATSQLPQSVLNVVDDLLELARRIDLQLGKNTVQITYQGVLDLADVLRKIPGINNLSFNGLDLPITNPSVTITKPEVTASGTPGTWKDASFSFKADKLPTEQLANWLTNKAGSILPTTISKPVEEILTAFGPVNVSLSNDKFQFSADTIKLGQVINAIPGLNSIFTSVPDITLKNTNLTLSNFGKDTTGQSTTKYQFATSGLDLGTLATSLGLPSNISQYLPNVNLFVGSDRLLFSAPQSLDLKTIVPINSLGLPEIITKYIPDIKLDNAQLSITKTGTSGKEINLSGTISGLELGLTYSNGKWTFKGIDDGGRLSALDLIDLLKQGKGKAKQGFFDLVEYQLTGGANLGLTTKTSIEGNPAFPAFSFDLAANFPVFNYGNQQEASKTGANIKLNNIAIDLGSFISNLIGPIIKEVNEIIEPLKPVIQLLNSDTKLFTTLRLSGFDDNRDGKVTLLEIAKKLAPADQKAKIEKSQKFIKAVGDIVELITELSKMPANQPIIIDLGSYTLSGFKAASKDAKDAANKVETNNNGNTSALQTTNSTIDPIKQAEQKSSGKPASGFLSKLKNIEGLQFPVLTNPMKAIDLLLGKTTDLVIYDVPDLDFNFAMSKNFPIWGPIAGQLSGEFSAKTNLLVGFDSYGVNQWKDKRFAFKDIYRIFDGFYVGDWNAQGQDIDELVLNATIAAGLGLDIGFASAFMRGGIQGKVGLDFNDVGENNGTSDGKIRGSEIISRINNPLQLFDLNGNIDAFLDAKVSVAIVGTVWQKEFARFNLAKFSLGASGFSASGALSQSYIAGATIFFDVNFNNQWDEEEIKSITDEYGQFNLDLPVELDKNNNGQIDINEGQLLGLGGFDTSSGLPSGALIALPGATIITPLTSLQAKLVQGGLDRDEANTLVKQQLGLDLAVNLETFDPLKAVGENSANGLKVYLTHVQIQALLNQGRALLDGLQTATPEGQANPNNLLDAIAGLAKFLQQRSAQTQTGLDFTKETDLKPFFSFLITERNLTATEQQLDTVAQIVVQGNEYLSQIAQIATKRTLAEVLPAIASMKRLVQSDSTKLVTELAQGKKTSAEVEQEFETTLKKSNTFVDADIAAFGNRRIRVVTVNKEIAENSTNSVEFTIELNQPAPNQGLTVFYSLTGTATLNQDYKLDVSTDTIGELYIAPGQSTATIKVTAVNDTIDEPLETIAIRLKSVGEGYTIDPTGTVGLIEIQDDDQDVVNNPVTGIVKLGTFADDTLTGATGNDRLEGDYGDDNLDGKEGNDILRGGENNDTLTGGAGDDVLEGNYGDDNLNGGDGNDLLEGSIGEDTLKGGAGIDILKGGVDNDILEGNAGNDQIEGQSGNDILVGNEDNDWLVGGEGHDVLIGGLGDDILNGGQGADVFFLNSANDGFDTLLDFNPSQGDKIQISASGFGVDNLNDFTFLSGILDFQGKNLALIQNNGATYSFFPNLSEIIQIVDAPQAIPEVTPQVKAATEPLKTINTGVTAANSIPESTDTSNKSLLDKVLERGYITFGTSNSYATTLGFDLEFVKAIAVALFGDESKIKLVTTSFDDGFTQVANQTLDLTARRVSQNLDRDTERNVDFGPVYLYDYQAILVKADSNIENASDLKGKGLTIGVVSATNALGNLQNLLTPQGINFTPKEFKTTDELFAAYHNGEIAAISTDRALIYNRLGDAIAQNRILDVEFSQEPISLVLPENESEWADVVRWVTYATIQAEEFGITSENIGQIIAENTDTDTKNDASPAIRRFLGLQDELGKALNIRNDFVVQIIKQVGNYGEIYDRHFSNLERDLNLLWTDDGLMYSPPFSGVTQDIQLINNDQRNLLAEIQQRGVLKFGIPEGSTFPGFAEKNNDGTYQGFDIDLGRAIAVAVFGDASKIEFVSQQFNDGFANTANGKVDVSAAAYTHNLMRDASLGIDYSPIYLYTEQGILTRVDSDITALPLLNGRAVGVVAGTTALQNLEDALKVFDVKINPVIYSSSSEMYAAYDSKQVDAVFNDVSLLAGRISSLPHPEEHRIIRDNFTKEPLALIVDENQSDWADVVRWVTNALKQAEQYGITSKNIDQFIADNTDNLKENNSSIEIQAFLGLRGNIGTSLGLPNDFVVKMIKEVGNYSEIYARNFNTDLLPRQKNELSKELGLQTTAPLGINTNNLNSMPIAEDDNAQTTTNTAVNIDVLNNDKDLDNNPLTLSIVSTPSHGQVQINDNGTPNDKTDDFIIYTANSNFTGIDKFTYQVNDGKGGTDSASVNVSVKSAVVFNNQNNVLKLQGQLNNQKLKFSLNSKHLEKQVIHEVAFVAYDNEQGAVNGLLPGQNGYLNALLQRAEIIFSVIPDNFIADPTKIIDGFQSQYLGAVLLQDTSLDAVKADSSLLNRVLLGSPFNSSSSEILDINELAAGKLQLSFQDQLGDAQKDLILTVETTNEPVPLGADLQRQSGMEVVDLRDFNGKEIQALFPVVASEAAYDNTIGFYQVEDTQGTVKDGLTGTLFRPGDAGYDQAAIRNSQLYGVIMNNHGAGTQGVFAGGKIYAPYLIANGTVDGALGNTGVPVYFAFLGANPDKKDHVLSLGDNMWGFEDLPNGGDLDFNDIVVQAKFSVI
jgi:ABC-type amino acid transport substrate-binding protein/Ca2+-binding RTX toxin-like protein